MPTTEEVYSTANTPSLPEHIQTQAIKVCSRCRCPLSLDSTDSTPSVFVDDQDANIICVTCRERAPCSPPNSSIDFFTNIDAPFSRNLPRNVHPQFHSNRHFAVPDAVFDEDTDMDSSPASSLLLSPSLPAPTHLHSHSASTNAVAASTKYPSSADIDEDAGILSRAKLHQQNDLVPHDSFQPRSRIQYSSPDPLADITRIRVRSQRHHCLYPGAVFQGTQKSGRNSYDVTVNIVDVDFSSSFLCGYLCIRGLTDDWPELTTYFDAEIIGSRYGFLTQNWGANEQEDMVHWQRFPAFRHVKNELRKPHLTVPDRDRGAVFMRWKEKFLVPDHRVQDINGASFAGFYYVCVDFNHQTSSMPLCPVPQSAPLSGDEHDLAMAMPPPKPETYSPVRRRRDSSVRRNGRGTSSGPRSPPVATMSGFYFHQNSEPYQQLTLSHISERSNSSFEFR
ncbi:hypothetical protein CONPUDRAFT_97716 [Coniophora puteana RWD-64-598 SS2]|uniref:Vacuolar import and degradation protein n=1 Tax=Coniophora puteana (strain RWD-64-598) TaxID=741705 RepID=A0A5M3N0Y3_CONPW|nr:uncharacterized protein CONPUDRAFT_97716 [Coniophora puteana RWD-64-598 SS2]EIW85073.1 hypothetical protein CONPUDRAFT_97716 [Coniophora puteana RWD-64-598 SS2]